MKKCTARVVFTAFGVFSAGLYCWTQPLITLSLSWLVPKLAMLVGVERRSEESDELKVTMYE